jgi:hypothetical protein
MCGDPGRVSQGIVVSRGIIPVSKVGMVRKACDHTIVVRPFAIISREESSCWRDVSTATYLDTKFENRI